MVCPNVFKVLLVDEVVEHQLQGFGADSLVPIRFSYPVAHLAVVLSVRDVAGFMGVVADAADSLVSLFQHNRPCRVMLVDRLAVAVMVMTGAVVSLDFAWSFAGFIIYIFLLTHNNIKHHHQHETYGEADGAEIAVLAA